MPSVERTPSATAAATGLIYDIGMHNGDDTAYYLQHAARVVAVEANPVLASQGTQRFASEVAAGRLTVLNVAIADRPGAAEFWICDDVDVWSSFDRSIASRQGSRHHAIEITCRDFGSILAEHGTPEYCKIDIEGHDHFCLESMRKSGERPQYISLEMSHERGDQDLALLAELGYTRFKIINQDTFRPANQLLERALGAAPANKHLRLALRLTTGVRRHGSWRFPKGSSGPFGEQTPGAWRSLAEAQEMWYALHLLEERLKDGQLAAWFDIHATR